MSVHVPNPAVSTTYHLPRVLCPSCEAPMVVTEVGHHPEFLLPRLEMVGSCECTGPEACPQIQMTIVL